MWPSLFAESVSRNSCLEWDAVSAWDPIGKVCPTIGWIPGCIFRLRLVGKVRARNHRPIRPPINKEASFRAAGHEVHREFRTQRRPLNVAFVLRRTVEQETLYPAPPSGDRAVPATASCLDRRRRRTARFLLGRIYGGQPLRSWRRCRCTPKAVAPLRGSPDARAS